MLQNSPLDDLPVEVLETIVQQLQLRDVRKLRLTNTSLSAKISKGHFKTYLSSNRIQIHNDRDLKGFVKVTQEGWMGTLLQDLVIAGIVHSNRPTRSITREKATELLGEAFSNLKRYSPRGRLDSLSLTVEARGGGGKVIQVHQFNRHRHYEINDWRQVWDVSASTFQTAMQSLQASELPLRKLDAFGDVLRCSLAIDRFAADASRMESMPLQEVSLNLSNHISAEGDDREEYPLNLSEQHTSDLCCFLQGCPSLQCLKLRWYKVVFNDFPAALAEEKNFFNRLVSSVDFASLRDCSLIGVELQIADLLAFLRTTHLERLCLSEISLPLGGWDQVFDQIAADRSLEYLRLENLWLGNDLICYDAPGDLPFPCSEPNGPASLTLEGENVGQVVKFHWRRGVALGSAARTNWARRREWIRGPP